MKIYSRNNVELYHGDALEELKKLPDESIQMSMCSPPYYGLRDYKVDNQIGLEKTPLMYLERLWAVFDEVKRVLKKDGVIFVNVGDSYLGHSVSKKWVNDLENKELASSVWRSGGRNSQYSAASVQRKKDFPDKCLLMIPERFALGMIERGWILRNRICWFKRNAMPSSVKDRFTCTWEYVYFFSKNRRYYFDLDSVRIPHKEVSKKRVLRAVSNKHKYINNKNYGGGGGINKPRPNRNTKIPVNTAELYGSPRARYHREQNMAISQYQYGEGDYLVVNLNKKGRNPGDHWDITTRGFKGAHFAVYPEEICLMPIKAGSKPGDMVLDPFCGSGTTGVVATKLGRKFIGIDLNKNYLQTIAIPRIENARVLI